MKTVVACVLTVVCGMGICAGASFYIAALPLIGSLTLLVLLPVLFYILRHIVTMRCELKAKAFYGLFFGAIGVMSVTMLIVFYSSVNKQGLTAATNVLAGIAVLSVCCAAYLLLVQLLGTLLLRLTGKDKVLASRREALSARLTEKRRIAAIRKSGHGTATDEKGNPLYTTIDL